jgi:clan AA aspartic protease (TIGR02281 family)
MSLRQEMDGRIEPTLDAGVDWANISFVSGPRAEPAGVYLRTIAFGLGTLYIGFNAAFAVANGKHAMFVAGGMVGSALLMLLPVWISSWWDANRTQRTRFKVAAISAGVLLSIQLLAIYSIRGTLRLDDATALTSDELVQRALRCQRSHDLACAEKSWQQYVQRNPQDGRGLVTLGMIKGQRDDHAGAIQLYERAIANGIGGYDLFAFYAASLEHLGRVDQALEWYYAALAVSPRLVDVRAALARLLVAQSRPYEALGVLQAFDSQLMAAGRQPYFTAQSIAIEDRLREAMGQADSPPEKLRLAAMEGHFFAPVKLGWARATPFMVDTGATLVSLSTAMLQQSKVGYQLIDPSAEMLTADGRRVSAQVVVLRALNVGPHILNDVKAIVCKDCVPLLGASALSRFDMQSSKTRGLEFLSLVPRG